MEQGWLTLRQAAVYSTLSEKTLRRYIGHGLHPLPVRPVGRRLVIAPADLDAWIRSFERYEDGLDTLVGRVIGDLRRRRWK